MKKRLFTGILCSGLLLSTVNTALATTHTLVQQEIQQETLSTTPASEFAFSNGTITSFVGSSTHVVVPSTINGQPVVRIGAGAFIDRQIQSLTLPSTVTTIEEWAIKGCTEMTKLDLGGNVTTIGEAAFLNSASLTEVVLPSTLTSLGKGAFGTCNALTSIRFDGENPYYTIEDNVIYNKDKTILLQYVGGRDSSHLTVPSTVEQIVKYAFNGIYSLESIHFPKSLQTIETDAFDYFDYLGKVQYEGSTSDWSKVSHGFSSAHPVMRATWTYNVPIIEMTKTARPSTAKVMVNGKTVNFGAYEIDGFNYFKLTDLSYALSGTSKQFQVTWDSSSSCINMKINSPHLVLGTELQGNSGKTEVAERFLSTVLKNSAPVNTVVYTIQGSSYFQLDALKEELGLQVGWDGNTSTITITA